jgi:hypothetical protein
MDDQLKNNLTSSESWIRILFMMVYAVVLYLVSLVFIVLVPVQTIFVLVSGDKNFKLLQLSNVLVQYVTQCLSFVNFNSDEKPYPFSDFPVSDLMPPPEEASPQNEAPEHGDASEDEAVTEGEIIEADTEDDVKPNT